MRRVIIKRLTHPFFICLLIGGVAWKVWATLYPPMLGEVSWPSTARVNELREGWFRAAGAVPDAATLDGLIEREINDRVLLAEAQRLQLHIGDPVIERRLLQDAEFLGLEGDPERVRREILALGVLNSDQLIRRRLIQRMESIGRGRVDPAAATQDELRAIYEAEPARWREAPLLSFVQLYFSIDKPAAESRAQQALQQLQADSLGPDSDAVKTMGDVFLHGRRFGPLRDYALQGIFGSAFMQRMQAQQGVIGQWLGPVPSSYGYHLVWVSEFTPARQKAFAEVEPRLRRDWAAQQEQARLREFVSALRERYIVVGEPAA